MKSRNAAAVVAKPSGTRTPRDASWLIISPSEAFLPPTRSTSVIRSSLKGTTYEGCEEGMIPGPGSEVAAELYRFSRNGRAINHAATLAHCALHDRAGTQPPEFTAVRFRTVAGASPAKYAVIRRATLNCDPGSEPQREGSCTDRGACPSYMRVSRKPSGTRGT